MLSTGLRSRLTPARLPLTPRHRQAWLLWFRERVDLRVEWHSAVFSDESSFCLYTSNRHTRVRHRPGERYLPECIRSRHTGPTSGFIVWGAISHNSRSRLVFLQDKVNSAHFIVQVFKHVLLLFLRQEGGAFQQDNAPPLTAVATQRGLRVEQLLPRPVRSPRSLVN